MRSQPLEEDPAAAAELAALAVQVHGRLEGRPLNMRQLMKTGVLAQQAVQYRSRHHPVGLTGKAGAEALCHLVAEGGQRVKGQGEVFTVGGSGLLVYNRCCARTAQMQAAT